MDASSGVDEGDKRQKSEETLQQFRQRTKDQIRFAFKSGGNHLIEALPVLGKSHSVFTVANETDTEILYLVSIDELKNQAEDWCEEFGLNAYRIPTPHNTCPSFNEEEYGEIAQQLREDYRKGVSGKDSHTLQSLPCTKNSPCPYIEELERDISDFQVLIGNPKHAYNRKYLENRLVIKDEFSEHEYEMKFTNVEKIINRFLNNVSLPFNDYQDILDNRDDNDSNIEDYANAGEWYKEYGAYRDTQTAIYSIDYHAYAPLLTYAIIFGTDWELENGWEHFPLDLFSSLHDLDYVPVGPQAKIVRNTENNSMFILNPPEFEIADGFVGLDGTPTPELWEMATGLSLSHEKILNDMEKKQYIDDIMNYEIIQTNESEKAYSGGGGITAPKDTKIAHGIYIRENEKPGLITSKKAIDNVYPNYNNGEIFEYIDNNCKRNFARVRSINEFEDKQLGFVSGYRHYGDEYIQKWGAYKNESISSPDQRGPEKSYGEFGDKVHNYLKILTLQDVFRFGRNREPTTVYVNTSVLPDWVPTKKVESLQIYPLYDLNQSKRETVEYLRDTNSPASAREISENIGRDKSTVNRSLSDLHDDGLADKEEQPGQNEPHLFSWRG